MSSGDVVWPKKQGELYHNHFDSSIWNDFEFRDDDIIIATYAKSGTTWLQQIVGQLIFDGAPDTDVGEMSPWVDLRLPPPEVKMPLIEQQTHRRFLKTHLPVDALVYSPKAKYLFIARDGRDVVWSFHNHHINMHDEFIDGLNESLGPDVEPLERVSHKVYDYFHRWLEQDGYPLWQFWRNILSWWNIRDLPNIRVLHFQNLKDDLDGEMRKIAEFLEIDVNEDNWDTIVEHCTFDYMHANAEKSAPLGGKPFKGGAKSFIHKGTNGRWRDILTDEDNARYEALAVENLGSECAHWLKTGEMAQN